MSTGLTTPPDEQGLQALLKEAYEQLPAPDSWRLKDIEERLSRQLARAPRPERRPLLWPWWLAAALVAASAAAAWWAYGLTRTEPSTEQIVVEPPATPGAPATAPGPKKPGEERSKTEGAEAARPSRGEQPSPLIYRRERP